MKTTTIRVDPDVYDLFKVKAKTRYRTASAELRRLMAEYVEQTEKAA